jgi:hypothetical protein
MTLIHHSTALPVELPPELIARVAKNHAEILVAAEKNTERESTGNARYAVTKPSTIPPWVK